MSILDKHEGTKAEKAFEHRKKITDISKKLYRKNENLHRQLFNMVWESDELTPQEILDEYGTDAKDLFIFSGQIQGMLLAINPNYIALDTPNEYVINLDGTITIGDPRDIE